LTLSGPRLPPRPCQYQAQLSLGVIEQPQAPPWTFANAPSLPSDNQLPMSEPIRAKYRQYLDSSIAGLRREANKLAQEVVAEYHKNPDQSFIVEICESNEHKLNHHIWKGTVLPLYLADSESPVAIKCMIRTIQNLYSYTPAFKQLDWITEHQLIDKLLTIVPDDEWATSRKIEVLSNWLAHAIHEWPSGVLYGMGGATIEQCGEVLDGVAQLRALDTTSRFEALCREVTEKTMLYRDRLEKSKYEKD